MTLMTHLALMGPYNFFLSNKMCCRNRTSPQFLKVENNILILFIGTAVSGPNTKHHILRSLLLSGVVRSSDTLSKSSLPKFLARVEIFQLQNTRLMCVHDNRTAQCVSFASPRLSLPLLPCLHWLFM